MAYTEIKEKDKKRYFYRVKSIRKGKKVSKKRVYLGRDLNKKELLVKEESADKELGLLSHLLSSEEEKELKIIQENYKKQPKGNLENKYEAFCSLFSYGSTNIEGNTLTLQETAQLLFENITPKRSLREINEVINHKEAFDLILKTNKNISEDLILELHSIVAKNTLKEELRSQIGRYRELQVYIRGTTWLPVKPQEVKKEMKNLLSWYTKNKTKINPIVLAAYFHIAFETIHPFIDGNGRVGRLLLNFILHNNNFPMINIPHKEKHVYYQALETAQIKGDIYPFVKFLIKLLKEDKIRF